jgi:uncharacterized integral membrane protein
MQIIRTILWVLITAVLVAFIAMNWTKVPVNIWPMDDGNYLHLEWPVGVIALVFFLLGAVPMWIVHRAGRWRMQRRIHALENTVSATSAPSASTLAEPASASMPLTAPVIADEPGFNPSEERSQI